jgi:hypothetical protein
MAIHVGRARKEDDVLDDDAQKRPQRWRWLRGHGWGFRTQRRKLRSRTPVTLILLPLSVPRGSRVAILNMKLMTCQNNPYPSALRWCDMYIAVCTRLARPPRTLSWIWNIIYVWKTYALVTEGGIHDVKQKNQKFVLVLVTNLWLWSKTLIFFMSHFNRSSRGWDKPSFPASAAMPLPSSQNTSNPYRDSKSSLLCNISGLEVMLCCKGFIDDVCTFAGDS